MSTHDIAIVAQRYSRALFALAHAQAQLDATASDLQSIRTLVSDNPELQRFISSPLLSREDKAAALDAILAKAGASNITRQFMKRVALNRRLDAFGQIADEFDVLMNEARGEVVADISSAKPLSAADLKTLTSALTKALSRNIRARAKVDTSLLGGVSVQVAGQMIDYSLKSQLSRLEKQLKKTVSA